MNYPPSSILLFAACITGYISSNEFVKTARLLKEKQKEKSESEN